MSTPNFNPNPRGLLIQPINRAISAEGKPAINYYVCVIDLPNTMFSEGVTPLFSVGNPAANTPTELTFVLENVLFSGYPPTNAGFTNFSTWLIPIYTKQDGPFTSIKVKDKKAPTPSVKSGQIVHTTPLKEWEVPQGENLTATVFQTLQARPFVIKNGSDAANNKNYFVGCISLAPPNLNFTNKFKTMTSKSAASPKTLLCTLNKDTGSTAAQVAAIGCLQVTKDEFTHIEVSDGSANGTNIALDYNTPDATI
jgi:hypothetical protein